jgi:hypothetical protein
LASLLCGGSGALATRFLAQGDTCGIKSNIRKPPTLLVKTYITRSLCSCGKTIVGVSLKTLPFPPEIGKMVAETPPRKPGRSHSGVLRAIDSEMASPF